MTRSDPAQRTSRIRRLTAVATPVAVAGWITLGAMPVPVAAGTPSHTRPPVRSSTPSPLTVHPNVAVAPARSYTVNSTADGSDTTPGDGQCATVTGACTLRAAVEEANADSGLTSVIVPAGSYTLTLGQLVVSASSGMDISGAGAPATVIHGGGIDRILEVQVSSGSLVTVRGLGVTGGHAPLDPSSHTPANGGAVLVDPNSSVELDSVDVGFNTTTIDTSSGTTGRGGGIADSGQLWLIGSRVHDNTANTTGGGLYVDGAAQIESATIDHNVADANDGNGAGGGGLDNLGTVSLSGTTVSANSSPAGGGISNRGTAWLATTTVTGNSATTASGGGIDNEASLSMATSRVTGNHAGSDGGGILQFGSTLAVNRSTVDGNHAGNDGGGVASESQGVTLTDDTVSGNSAARGAGLVVQYPTTLRNTTVAGNGSGTGIADLAGGNPEIDVQDSIVAVNSGGNCTSPLQVRSLGHNLDSDGTCTLSGSGDISNRDARLGPLQDNGGPTPTMALLMDSPAIDAGDGQCAALDQRGVGRPQGAGCDMGAFELAPYYWMVAADGGIFSFGGAPFYGSEGATRLNKPIVGMAATPDGLGYWMVGADGGVFAFGDAGYFGGRGGQPLNQPVVGMAPTPDGRGYWLVARDGGIFNYGDAVFYGSTGAMHLNAPVVGIAADPLGRGYWLVASDGGIFTFGTPAFMASGFHGSMGATRLNQPVVGIAAAPDGGGYWMVATDGGIFNFGSAGFFGSMGAVRLNKPVVGMAPAPDGQGYWMVASDGGIFNFGHAPFFGSTGDLTLNAPMVGMAGV